jgi:hypothetical protein
MSAGPPNELEILAVRYARGATLAELAVAFEASRVVPGDEATTVLFARAASLWHDRRDDPPEAVAAAFATAYADALMAPSGADRLEAGLDRVRAAQEIAREREGEGRGP